MSEKELEKRGFKFFKLLVFFVLERILYILIFPHTKRCLASEGM